MKQKQGIEKATVIVTGVAAVAWPVMNFFGVEVVGYASKIHALAPGVLYAAIGGFGIYALFSEFGKK